MDRVHCNREAAGARQIARRGIAGIRTGLEDSAVRALPVAAIAG